MKIHKDAVVDAVLLFVGSAVGAAASTAYMVHRWLRKSHHGARASSAPSGLRTHHGRPEEAK